MEDITTLQAENGILDFSSIAFDENRIYSLSGEWAIIDGKLHNSDSFNEKIDESYLIKVPSPWAKESKEIEYGTYKLVLKNLPIGEKYAIEVHDIRSASKVIVDDKVLFTNGKVSEGKEGSDARNVPRVAYFEIGDSTSEIIIQVSNYEYPSGGIIGKIFFASQEKMHNKFLRNLLFEAMMLAFIFIIALIYWLIRIIVTKNEKIRQFSFVLGCSSIFIIIINGLLSHKILHIIFPILEFELALRVLFISIGVLSMLVGLMVRKTNIQVFNSKIWFIFNLFYYTYLLLVLLTSFKFSLLISKFFLIANNLIFMLIAIRIAIVFIKEKEQEECIQKSLLLIGIINFIIFNIELTLYYMGVITEAKVAFPSILFYSLFLMILLLYNIYLVDKKNEESNHKLKKMNKDLVKTIERSEKYQLDSLQAQIKPHFLFNTLSTIISLCETNKDKACLLIKKLSDYLKNSYEFSPENELVKIRSELQLIDTYLFIQKQRFEERLEYEVKCDIELFDYKIPQLMIQPLIENALVHGVLRKIEGGKVQLKIMEIDENIVISIVDNGVGFNNNRETFSTKIGLKNINRRLNFLYNEELRIESSIGRTEVKFKVPKIR